MKYRIVNKNAPDLLNRFADVIINEFNRRDYRQVRKGEPVNFIFNLTDMDQPEAGIRKSQAEFVVSLVLLKYGYNDLRSACYTTLIKTLSNILVCIDPGRFGDPPEVYITTPETGFYHFPLDSEKVFECLVPIVESRLVISNHMSIDLPQSYWRTTPVVQEIKKAGRRLDSLGVLPAPFPLHKVLDQEGLDHLYRLFRMRGLSYGNFSAREKVPGLSEHTFWMTARGVNKSRLKGIGEDILLVTGYDENKRYIKISVPPLHNKRARVSVDAIEHTLIYQTFSGVGAIVHVHAWIEGIVSTKQNHPCGTIDLGKQVVNLLKQTPDPTRCTVGLINHGLTITGPTLQDIFDRIQDRLVKNVPMSNAVCTP
ncbi:MAG: class II aldolase/adducin family protein [Bacteroidales bacterium]|nr:class II aldolase/adducin family protein [Bacteroidales bacterium]